MRRSTPGGIVALLALACVLAAVGSPRGPGRSGALGPGRLGAGTVQAVPVRPGAGPGALGTIAQRWPHGIPVEPITTLRGRGRTITLTFDDGPDPRWTPAVLDLLRRYHARAVFCLVGIHVVARPDLVRRIAREGHVLCDHTWTHDEYLWRRPMAEIRDEIGRTARAITRAAGVPPVFYRAPGGNWGSNVIAVARAGGLAPLGWAVDPRDWARPGTGVIIDRVLSAARPGAVVLMHDGYGARGQSVAALRVILATLAARGYRFAVPGR
ncbi:MAG TPA: polysaccharide deacetylase family protein [Mycobacteriales bacterium]|nr:polysaccharide deacetylase family protein [Mycobacteriales bacterium]